MDTIAFLLHRLPKLKQKRLLRTHPKNLLTVWQNLRVFLEIKTPSDDPETLLVPLISSACDFQTKKMMNAWEDVGKRLREEAYYAISASVKEMRSDGIQAWSHLGGILLTAVLILCNGLMSATWMQKGRSKAWIRILWIYVQTFYMCSDYGKRTGQSEPSAKSALPFKRDWNR